jgi:hypothetical protein
MDISSMDAMTFARRNIAAVTPMAAGEFSGAPVLLSAEAVAAKYFAALPEHIAPPDLDYLEEGAQDERERRAIDVKLFFDNRLTVYNAASAAAAVRGALRNAMRTGGAPMRGIYLQGTDGARTRRGSDAVYRYFMYRPGSSNPASSKLRGVVKNILKFAREIYGSKNVFYRGARGASGLAGAAGLTGAEGLAGAAAGYGPLLTSPEFESFVEQIVREDIESYGSYSTFGGVTANGTELTHVSRSDSYYTTLSGDAGRRGADAVYRHFMYRPGSSEPASVKLRGVVKNILKFAREIYGSKNVFYHGERGARGLRGYSGLDAGAEYGSYEEFFASPLFESFVEQIVREDVESYYRSGDVFTESSEFTHISQGDSYYTTRSGDTERRSADTVYRHFMYRPGSSEPASVKLRGVVKNILKFAREIYGSKNVFYHGERGARGPRGADGIYADAGYGLYDSYEEFFASPLFESFVEQIVREDVESYYRSGDVFTENSELTHISQSEGYYSVSADDVFRPFLRPAESASPDRGQLYKAVRNIVRIAQNIMRRQNIFLHGNDTAPAGAGTENRRGAGALDRYVLAQTLAGVLPSILRSSMLRGAWSSDSGAVYASFPELFNVSAIGGDVDSGYISITDAVTRGLTNSREYYTLLGDIRRTVQNISRGSSADVARRLRSSAFYPQTDIYLTQNLSAGASAPVSPGNVQIPDWAGSFINRSFQEAPTVSSGIEPVTADARRVAAGQTEQTVWTAPGYGAAAAYAPPVDMKLKEHDRPRQQAAFTQADITKLTDKVYDAIEKRLATERRRMGM